MILHLIDLSDDTLIDTITLSDAGELHYATGGAQEMVDGWMRNLGITPQETLEQLSGWSNGYVVMRPDGTTPSPR